MPHIDIHPSTDGRMIEFAVTNPPQIGGITAPIPAKDIGHFITGVLGAAIDCAKKTGEFASLKLKEADKKKLLYAHASEMAVTDAVDAADAAVLVFAIGATELSIGIHKSALADIGRALLTISASSTPSAHSN